jgi:hypothetical protein
LPRSLALTAADPDGRHPVACASSVPMEHTGATHCERRGLAECSGGVSDLHVVDGSAAIAIAVGRDC